MSASKNPDTRKITWFDEYLIHSYEVDVGGKLTLSGLCHFMQESAWNHAEHLGLGYSHLLEKNLAWILSRQLIRVADMPEWGDKIIIATWPSGRDRLYCYRDFKISDTTDRVLARGTTAWFVIDMATRKPQRTDSYYHLASVDLDPSSPPKPEKISLVRPTGETTSVRVGYRDMDVNEHVNNVRYIDWIIDSYPFDFLKTHRPSEIEINYLAEALIADDLSVETEKRDDLIYYHKITRKPDERELCRAKIVW